MASISMLLLLVLLGLALDKAFSYHCDFEEGTCGWENSPGNAAGCGWSLRKGLAVTPDSGPFADHTYGTPNGTYLYFQSSYCSSTDNNGVGVVLPIKGFNQNSICVKFWYLMYGNGNQYVLALQKDEEEANPIFISAGVRGRSWKFAQVSVNQSSNPYSLILYAFGGVTYADVALDDIDITDGQCEAAVNLCDFERGDLCQFNVTKATEDFRWSNIIAAELTASFYMGDHTLSSYAGHVAVAFSEETKQGVTSMVSPVQQSPEMEQCLTFSFFLLDSGSSANTVNESAPSLSVYILTDRQNKVTPAWSVVGGYFILWEYATVPISLKEPYQYSFVASKGSSAVIFFVDDISVHDGPCSPRLACSFTKGSFCDWISPTQHGPLTLPQLAWMADEPYPEISNTVPNTVASLESEGGYIFLDSKYLESTNPDNNEAIISSQRFPLKINGSWCFSFDYRLLLQGNAQAQLSVQQVVESTDDPSTLFTTSNSTAGQWVNQKVDVRSPGASNFFLAVAGDVYPTALMSCRIELDNFLLSERACHA